MRIKLGSPGAKDVDGLLVEGCVHHREDVEELLKRSQVHGQLR